VEEGGRKSNSYPLQPPLRGVEEGAFKICKAQDANMLFSNIRVMDKDTGFGHTGSGCVAFFMLSFFCILAFNIAESSKSFFVTSLMSS